MEQNSNLNFGTVVAGTSYSNPIEVCGSSSSVSPSTSGSSASSNNGRREATTLNFNIRPLPSRANKGPRKNVPEEAKDAAYWATRTKNANATRQSRLVNQLKREKALARCKFLEKACAELELKIVKLAREDDDDYEKIDESG